QIEEHVEAVGGRVLAAGADRDHAIHRLAFVLGAAADEHARPIATDGGVVVVPAGDAAADVFFHSLAFLCVFEAGEHLRFAAFVGPGRDNAGEIIVAASIGVDVGLHVDAAAASGFDQLDDFLHAAPVFLIGDFDVDNIDRNVGSLTNS